MAVTPANSILAFIRSLATTEANRHAPDRELLRRFVVEHDQLAFATLVQRHGPMILSLCRRLLGNWHDAEDVFQATFLVLARKSGVRVWHDSIGNWLYLVAYRLARRAQDGAVRRSALESRAVAREQADPDAEITWRELQGVLDEELTRLPLKYREPIVHCCLEGATRDEAARQLGWPLGTLKKRLERGREMLRSRLARRGITLSAALLTPLVVQGEASAAVPAALARATVHAAHWFAAGKALNAGVVSARAVVLAKEGMKAMLVTKLKVSLVLCLGFALLAGGVTLTAQQGPGGDGKPKATPDPSQVTNSENEIHALYRVTYWKSIQAGGFVHELRWSPDGKTVSCKVILPGPIPGTGREPEIRAWDSARGERVEPPQPQSKGVSSPDGKLIAVTEERQTPAGKIWAIKVQEVAGRTPGSTIEGESIYDHYLLGYAFSPDGKMLATSQSDGRVTLWDPLTGRPKHELKGHERSVGSFAFSPDSKMFATASVDKTLRLWDVASGKLLHELEEHTDAVSMVAFLPDGKSLVSVSADRTARLWDAATGKQLQIFDGHESGIQTFNISPDGKILATGTEGVGEKNGKVRLWDMKNRKVLAVLGDHTKNIATIAFSSDGKALATGGGDGTIRLWRLPVDWSGK